MKKIGIVTDSTSSITLEEAKRLGIKMLPMPFYIGDECYYENVTLSREVFFDKLQSGVSVSTSQPAPTEVMKIWDEALEEYEQILYMPISSGLSGSCQTATMLAASSTSEEVTKDWIRQIEEVFPGLEVLCDDLSMGVSCHIGYGGLGIGLSCKPLSKGIIECCKK